MTTKKSLPLAIMLSLGVLVSCAREPTEAERLSKAREYQSKGDTQAAVIELKNALQVSADNGEIRYSLGVLYGESGDFEAAEKELVRANELGYDDDLVMPLLGRAWLEQGKHQQIIEALALRPEYSRDAAVDISVTRGLALLALGNLQAGQEAIDAAAAQAGDNKYVLEGKVRAAALRGEWDEARLGIGKLLEMDPGYGRAWTLLGQIEQAQGNLPAAEDAFGKAIDSKKVADVDLLYRAMVRIDLKKFDEAEEDLDELDKLKPNYLGVDYGRGMIFLQQGNFKAAQASFEKVLGATDEFLPAMYYAGVADLALGHGDLAERNLNRFVAKVPGNGPGNRMLALMSLQRGEFPRAEELARIAIKADPNDLLARGVLSDALFGQNKGAEAIASLRQMIELAPESVGARTALANGLLRQGDMDAAVAELKAAIERDPTYAPAPAMLARVYLEGRKFDEAEAVAQQFIDANPDSPSAHSLAATVYLGRDQPEKAVAAFKKALELAPGDPSADGGLAMLAVKDNNLDKAREYYNDALAHHPGHLGTTLNLAELELAQKNVDEAQSLLEKAIENNPAALEPRLRIGTLYLQQGHSEKVLELFEGIKEQYPENVAMLGLLADSAVASKRFQEARVYVQQLLRLVPQNDRAHYLNAKILIALGDTAAGRKSLERSLALQPGNVPARIDLAELLLRLGELDAAEIEISNAEEIARESDRVAVLRGQLAELRGDRKAAAEFYAQAYERARNNLNLLRLTNAQWENGEREAALASLEGWLREFPDDSLTRVELGNRYVTLGRDSDAVAAFEKTVVTAPDNVIALNNLAWLLRDTDNARALGYAESAAKLAPDSLDIMDTRAMVLLSRGRQADKQQARRLMDQVLEKRPADPVARYHGALVSAAMGDKDSAISALETVLSGKDQFPGRPDAEKLLQDLQK